MTAAEGDAWLHEIKVDGCRYQLHLEDGAVRMFTRRGCDWSERFRTLADAAEGLPVRQAVIEREIIVATPEGPSDFAALQAELAAERSDRVSARAISPASGL